MNRPLDIIASIPRQEWIDLLYAMLVPSATIVGAVLLLALRP